MDTHRVTSETSIPINRFYKVRVDEPGEMVYTDVFGPVPTACTESGAQYMVTFLDQTSDQSTIDQAKIRRC
jgi:hypothetical protein